MRTALRPADASEALRGAVEGAVSALGAGDRRLGKDVLVRRAVAAGSARGMRLWKDDSITMRASGLMSLETLLGERVTVTGHTGVNRTWVLDLWRAALDDLTSAGLIPAPASGSATSASDVPSSPPAGPPGRWSPGADGAIVLAKGYVAPVERCGVEPVEADGTTDAAEPELGDKREFPARSDDGQRQRLSLRLLEAYVDQDADVMLRLLSEVEAMESR